MHQIKSQLNLEILDSETQLRYMQRGSSMMVIEGISARGRRSNRSSSGDETSRNTERGKIKTSEQCEMFKFVKLGKLLGEGAYGQVYQALQTRDHKFIVVKKIPIPEHIDILK